MGFPTNEPATENSPQPGAFATTSFVATPGATIAGAATIGRPEVDQGVVEMPAGGPDGESLVWEGRYSPRNFLIRLLAAAVLTAIWVALALQVWALGRPDHRFLANAVGLAAAAFWAFLGFRFLRASQSHQYRLTTRRLFLSSGFIHRRVDQIELVRIKDLYVRQSIVGQWLNVGTVVVVSSEPSLPRATLLGIGQPQRVMDLIWQNTRREQDRKTTAVQEV